ncbi:MAG: hypothetical protein AAF735_07665 [Myxococcota bacterium]
MPIFGRTPKKCFDEFRDAIAPLLTKCISLTAHLRLIRVNDFERLLTIGEHGLKLDTVFGTLYLLVLQRLNVVEDKKHGYRLQTLAYAYRLQGTASRTESKPLLRWEYEKHQPRDTWPRNHMHAAATLSQNESELDLNKLHLPTGWVTLEEVIRFAIHELGHAPPVGDQWWELLVESERRFYTDFSGKGYS